LSRHEGLRVATVFGCDGAALHAEFSAAAAMAPHLVCVHLGGLSDRAGVCAVLKSFRGALLVLEAPPDAESTGCGEEDQEGLLRALGVTSRWSVAEHGFESLTLPPALVTEIIGDLKLKDLEQDPDVVALVSQAQPLYDHHFHEDLIEDVRSRESAQVGFLVARREEGDGLVQSQFLGLIVYKHWGPPLRVLSILRLAVPSKFRLQGFGRVLMRWAIEKARQMPRTLCARLTLNSMPEAIPFYQRLQFTPIPQDENDDGGEPRVEEVDAGQPMPGALWMEMKCGRSFQPVGKR